MFTTIYETDASNAVGHSAFGRFLPGQGRQLITICSKTLRIYRFNPYAHYIDTDSHEWQAGLQLECICRFDLLTPVRSFGVARIPVRPDVDSLVLAFDQAKVSIVCFDNAKFGLETISLHDFEDEELRDGFKTEEVIPKVCVDPLQRCAVALVYGRHFAILPLNEGPSIRSYTVSLKKIDDRLTNVIDIVFLHGYYEPTLLIVYEPIQTTAGRATVRYDTVSILAVSLNIKDRVHAVIWNLGNLPNTINQCHSLPAPVGGACLFGSNEIIYLNQAVPPCGLALNSDVDDFTRFPFSVETKSLRLTLDGCVVEALNENEILIATRNGQLHLLTMNVDISNAVKQMKLQKVLDTNLPHTLTLCYPGYIFLGSRLGDSLLLRYEKEDVQYDNSSRQAQTEEQDVPMDDDDLYLYTSQRPTVTKKAPVIQQNTTLKFSIVDRLLNNAPCKALRVASANDVQIEFENKALFFDLVTASGHERSSSLCFFQRTVRPFIQSVLDVEGALELFTIDRHNDKLQNYLFVAFEMATKVYEIKKTAIDLVDKPIFQKQETSLLIGDLKNGEIIVQVTPMHIVLAGPNASGIDERIMILKIDTNFPIASASVVYPYIAMITQNGRLILYKVEYTPHLALNRIPVDDTIEGSIEKSSFTAISIYKDLSGLMQLCLADKKPVIEVPKEVQEKVKLEASEKPDSDMDDIDAMLYGTEEKQQPAVVQSPTEQIASIETNGTEEDSDVLGSDVIGPKDVVPSYYLLTTRENGTFCIYSLDVDLQMVFRVKRLHDLPEQLKHTPITTADLEDAANEVNQPQDLLFARQSNIPTKLEDIVMEIRLNGLGLNSARPVLSIMVDDIVWFYELFRQDDGVKGALMVRFRRLEHHVVTRSIRFMSPQGKNPVENTRDVGRRRSFINPYDRIGDLTNGLFIAGNYPSFLVSAHGEFLLHPFIIDGPILSCCAFNDDVRCRNGMIYLRAKKTTIRTAHLNPDIRYDISYPVRRIPFDETVRFVVFLLRWNIFALVTCKAVPHNQLCIVTNEEKLMETYKRDDNYVLPEMDKFTLQLFSTFDWNFIPKSAIEFDEFETVTCCEEVLLNSESTLWGLQSYLAIGTALNYGEEVFVRGRILIYEIIDVVPEEGMPTTRNRLKCVYDKEQKGPVTSMCHCEGLLLTGMAQKVFIWQFKDGQLNGVSFLDMHFYVHNLVGFRSLTLACDMFRSLSLIRYQSDHKVLSLISKDFRPFTPSPMSAQFLLDRQHLMFVLSDENGNISLFSYMPESPESRGGENLIMLGSSNIGSASNGIVRVNGYAGGPFLEAIETPQETQSNIICTLDGSWAVLRPINERAFRRLQILQQLMVSQVPQSAGLNPKGSRAAKPQKLLQQPKGSARAIIDCNFVFQFMNLSTAMKADLARASGSNRYQIMEDITTIRRSFVHF